MGNGWKQTCYTSFMSKLLNFFLPHKDTHKKAHLISPSATVQAALLVRFNKKGSTLADLARSLGTSWPAAQRLEDPKHSPTLRQLERAAAALGKRLVLSFE